MSPNFLENMKCIIEEGGKEKEKLCAFELGIFFFLCKVRFGKISNDMIFSPFKTEWNPRWDASTPRAEFPRIKEWIAGL